MMEQPEPRNPRAAPGPVEVGEPRSDRLAAEVEALVRLNEATSRLWHLSDPKAGLEQLFEPRLGIRQVPQPRGRLVQPHERLYFRSQAVAARLAHFNGSWRGPRVAWLGLLHHIRACRPSSGWRHQCG